MRDVVACIKGPRYWKNLGAMGREKQTTPLLSSMILDGSCKYDGRFEIPCVIKDGNAYVQIARFTNPYVRS